MVSVPFCSLKPVHDELKYEIDRAISQVYQRGQFIMGTELAEFEREFAGYVGAKYCVGVASGYDALLLSLRLLGVGEGDEVIVPAHTYIASWLAVSNVGARVIPVDVDYATMLLDPDKIADRVTRKTKAIMPVHLYGQPCQMEEISTVAKRFGLSVVEDNAQAHGAFTGDKMTGSFGSCNATSFYPTKNLGALGDGGAITLNDERLYELALQIRSYGSREQYVNPVKGVNSRLDELQAAVLRVKLKRLNDWNRERKKIADRYKSFLIGIGDLIFQEEHLNSVGVYHLFVMKTSRRDELRSYLFQKGIGTMIHYPLPPHLQGAYSELGFRPGDFEVTEKLSKTIVSLPIWPGLTDDQIDWVIKSVKTFFRDH